MSKPSIKIAIVVSRFNEPVTKALLVGAEEQLAKRGIAKEQVSVTWVPGAVELPLIAQQYARQNKVDAVICIGAVIQGETDHYDYVCQQVSHGCQQVALQHNIPVIFGLLTTQNSEQAFARAGGARGNSGHYWADAALEMIGHMQTLSTQTEVDYV